MANEKRLIDLDATLNRLEKESWWLDSVKSCIRMFLAKAKLVDAVSRGVHEQVRWERDVAIEQLESYGVSLGEKAEVAKVVHGRWVFGTANHREYMKCSVCLKSQTPTGVFTYCPNCGAKMGGDGNG